MVPLFLAIILSFIPGIHLPGADSIAPGFHRSVMSSSTPAGSILLYQLIFFLYQFDGYFIIGLRHVLLEKDLAVQDL
jgi:hypothetical protein